jgi:hypothetical protein
MEEEEIEETPGFNWWLLTIIIAKARPRYYRHEIEAFINDPRLIKRNIHEGNIILINERIAMGNCRGEACYREQFDWLLTFENLIRVPIKTTSCVISDEFYALLEEDVERAKDVFRKRAQQRVTEWIAARSLKGIPEDLRSLVVEMMLGREGGIKKGGREGKGLVSFDKE